MRRVEFSSHGRRLGIAVDESDHIGARIIQGRRFYETDLLEDIFSRARPGMIVDVGAHIGNHTLFFAGIMDREVVSFEPDLKNREALEHNVTLNGLANVTIHPAAAGASRGWCRTEPMRAGNSGMTKVVRDSSGLIPVVAIDDLALMNVAVIKIDTEGFELEVLKGARETILRERPLLYVEAEGTRHAPVKAFLEDLGYREFGCYAKTPTYGFRFAAPRPISLSVAVMAHPARAAFVEELLPRLPGAIVVWDQRSDRWDTGKRSLLAFDPNATHHLVVQDDALVAGHLIEAVGELLQYRPHAPISLYAGRVRPNGPHFIRMMQRAQELEARWLAWHELCWGVGLVFPTQLIEEMVAFGDRQKQIQNYDMRLSKFLESKRIPTFYTVPSLVDHRSGESNPSLVPGRMGLNRVAHRFIGEVDARGLDWSGPVIVDPNARRRASMRCPECGADEYACEGQPADRDVV